MNTDTRILGNVVQKSSDGHASGDNHRDDAIQFRADTNIKVVGNVLQKPSYSKWDPSTGGFIAIQFG